MYLSAKSPWPSHPISVLLVLCLVDLFYVTPCAHAQPNTRAEVLSPVVFKARLLYGPTPASPSAPLQLERATAAEASIPQLIIGGTVGYGLGLLAGVFVGSQIDSDTEESWIGISDGMLIGGMLGASFGAPLGVHLSNGRRGNIVLMGIAAGVLQLIALPLLENGNGLVLLIPPAQVMARVGLARITS